MPVMEKELESVPQGEKILDTIVCGWPKLEDCDCSAHALVD